MPVFRIEDPRKQVCVLFIVIVDSPSHLSALFILLSLVFCAPPCPLGLRFVPSCLEPCDVVLLYCMRPEGELIFALCKEGVKTGRLPLVLSRIILLSIGVCP